jgi:hypothetical protein
MGSFVSKVPGEIGGGFFLVGTSTNNSGNQNSLHVSKLRSSLQFNSLDDEQFDQGLPITIDNLGTTQLQSVAASSLIANSQGYLVLANQIRSNGSTNIWISKINLEGDLAWSASFGSEDEDDMGAAVVELADGRILVLGTRTVTKVKVLYCRLHCQ